MMKKSLLFVSRTALSTLGMALNLIVSPAQAMDNPFHDDILTPTCRHLSVKELGLCAQVCRRWNHISSGDYVWEETARRYEESGGKFGSQFQYCISSISWKQILKVSFPEWREIKKKRELAEKQENTPLAPVMHLKAYNFFITPTFEDIKKGKIEQAARFQSYLKLLNFEPLNLESLNLESLNLESLNLKLSLYEPLNLELLNLQPLKIILEPLNPDLFVIKNSEEEGDYDENKETK